MYVDCRIHRAHIEIRSPQYWQIYTLHMHNALLEITLLVLVLGGRDAAVCD